MPYQFGDFTLDDHVFELRRDHESIPLRRQVFDALHYLISNRDRMVTKEELFRAISPGTMLTESSMAQCITDIRRAIGDDGRAQKLIRTRRGRGFQFVAPVEPTILPFPAWSRAPDQPQAPRRDAIAVLAFDSASGDPDETRFGKGVAEDLVRCLATWRIFPVISATSTWNYRREDRELPEVGRELGCAYLVEGRIQSNSTRVRVVVHVSDTIRGIQVWAERFEVSIPDLFALQDDIAGSIAIAIYPELLRSAIQRAMRHPPSNLDAWHLSLRGLAHFFREQPDENRLAIANFERALDQDPTSLLALFHLGYAHHLNWLYQWVSDQAAELAHVSWSAEQCLRIDPFDPSGHMLAGMVQIAQGESERALASLRTAVDANPSLAEAQALYGQALAIRGHAEDSVRHIHLAMRLSPRDPRPGKFHSDLAMAHFVARRYDDAMHSAERAILLNPDVLSNYVYIAASAAQLGILERAREAAAEIQRLTPAFNDAPFRRIFASSPDDIQERFTEGLQRAGVIPGEDSLLRIEITLPINFSGFTIKHQQKLISRLEAMLSSRSPIRVVSVSEGSVRVLIEVTQEQAEQLLWLYHRRVLDELGIKKAIIIGNAAAAAIIEEKLQNSRFDVFLCHNSKEKPEIKRLARRLYAFGILPWLDEWELRPGIPWQKALESQIERIGSVAVFVGNSGIGPWQDMELDAFLRQFVARRCPVIPAILRGCKSVPNLPPFLGGMTWVNFNKRRPDPYLRLVWGITGVRLDQR